MKRLLIGFLLILSLSAGVFWFVRLRPIYRSFYTDAEAIRAPVAQAPLREILWQPAARVPRGETLPIDEYEPRISADGSTLFFVRGKAGENADLFVAERDGAGWSEPKAIVGVNSDVDDLGPDPSFDGNTLYFYTNREGGLGGYDLWVARRLVAGWDAPTPLGPPVNSPYNDYGPALSPDGNMLYFASNRPLEHDSRDPSNDPSTDRWPATLREDFTVRTYDLYAARVTDDGIQAPLPIAAINTPFNEGAPAVSAFGDFLYFSSDRPGGRGGFDLYRSRRLRGEFRAPENLGDAVNTPANDLDPALGMGGYRLYFSSDRPQVDTPESGEHRYALFLSTSREVFRDVEVEQRPPIAWAAIWHAVEPWLLLAILALLALLTLLALVKTFRERQVSLLTKCLLGSLLAHVALMFLFTLWQVSASIAEGIRSGSEIQISLGMGGTVDALFAQIRGAASDAELPSADVPVLRPVTPMTAPPIPSILHASLAVVTLTGFDEASSVEPSVRETTQGSPKTRWRDRQPLHPPVDSPILPIGTPNAAMPPAPANEPALALHASFSPSPRRPDRDVEPVVSHSPDQIPPSALPATSESETSLTSRLPVEAAQHRGGTDATARQVRRPSPLDAEDARAIQVTTPNHAEADALRETDEPSIEAGLVHANTPILYARPQLLSNTAAEFRSLQEPVGSVVAAVDAADRADELDAHDATRTPRTKPLERRGRTFLLEPAKFMLASSFLPIFTGSAPNVAPEPNVETPAVIAPTIRPNLAIPAAPQEATTSQPSVSAIEPLPAEYPILIADPVAVSARSAPRSFSPAQWRTRSIAGDNVPALQFPTDSVDRPDHAAAQKSEAAPVIPPMYTVDDWTTQRTSRPLPLTEAAPSFVHRDVPAHLGTVDVGMTTSLLSDSLTAETRRPVRRLATAQPRNAQAPSLNLQLDLPEDRRSDTTRDATASSSVGRSNRRNGEPSEEAIGVIYGQVVDLDSGAPLAGSVVRLDLVDAPAMIATTNDAGEYVLAVPNVPDDFALSASRVGYAPSASNVKASAVEEDRLKVDFALRRLSEEVVVTEPAPELHHLGDDRFDGRINSQFQKESEGDTFEARFDLSDRQVAPYVQRAELRMLVKGVQRRHGLLINGSLLAGRLSAAPRDGGFGEFSVTLDPALLRAGENTLQILSAPPVGDDIDDFEFVNVQIHLALGVH